MQITTRYLYPPRPDKSPAPRPMLDRYQAAGWVGQIKFNDTRTLFSIIPNPAGGDPDVVLYGRHGEKRKNYVLSASQKATILSLIDSLGLDRSKWHYLDGGILCHKSKAIADIIVIWDILVADNEWLLESKYTDRYSRLVVATTNESWMFKVGSQEFDLGYKVGEQVLVPKLFTNYDEAWKIVEAVNAAVGWKPGPNAGEPALEGVIVRKMDVGLAITINDKQSCGWMIRSRVRTGRHRH